MRHESCMSETHIQMRDVKRTGLTSLCHTYPLSVCHTYPYPQSVCHIRNLYVRFGRAHVFRAYLRHDSHRHASQKRTWLISIWDMTHIWVMSHTEMSHVRFWDVCLCESCSDVGKTRSMSAICMSHISVSTICMSHISVSTICISYPLSVSQSVCHICWYRVAKTHRIHYLYRSFSAKEPYIYRVAKTHRTDCDTDSVSYLLSVSPQYETRVCESCIISYIHRLRR